MNDIGGLNWYNIGMMRKIGVNFVVRWVVSSLGLWLAAAILGPSRMNINGRWGAVIIAGLALALVNMALKPFLIFLSFPAIIVSLGLFMLVVNGLLVLVAAWIYSSLYVKDLGVAIIAGIIIALVNYLVTQVLEDFKT